MNTKEHALTAIARLLEVTEAAIRLGDWKVDGACDPDAAIEYAKHVLVSGGYAQNSNDDSWTAPAPEPRSTHRVWRDGEWLPCYCLAGCDHGIGSEQMVKRDPAPVASAADVEPSDEAIWSEQVRRMAEDAARYRWLRDPCSGAERVIFYCRGDYGRGLMSGSMLDAAIDDAMREEGRGDD